MEKPESGTGSGAGNGTGTGTWTKEIKTGDVSVLRVSLTIIARSRLFIPTLYIFIYCYYIFYSRIFCVRCKMFLREFHIRVSVATRDHDWHEYSSSLCRLSLTMDETRILRKGTSKNIKVFILLRFTEFEKMLPFCKNISVFVYRSRQSDESIAVWVRRGGTRGRLQGVHNPPPLLRWPAVF